MPDIEHIKGSSEGRPVSKRIERGRGVIQEEGVELDVTPVMNLFLVLIPFLVSMAVFTHLAIVEFSLPPAVSQSDGAQNSKEKTKELDVSIVVTPKGYTIVGSGQKFPLVPASSGKYNYALLVKQLRAIKYKYPSQESIILVFSSEVLYDDIIHFMDRCRESQFPNIGLSGGFE